MYAHCFAMVTGDQANIVICTLGCELVYSQHECLWLVDKERWIDLMVIAL